ncbi:MAG: SDR family NAD(P)-dependent oxidoreductase [Candidatus Latescibacterota bacterium]|nr:SDR family NAD(P)-dependent oxidoreductase [Candidatus Latescibacterota bacterium]
MRRVLVTGAAGGIGRSTAEAFAGEGARVALVDHRGTELRETLRAVGGEERGHLILARDVADPEQVSSAFSVVVDAWAGLDVLINCAALAEPTLVADSDIATWDRVVNTNLRGTFLCARAALTPMIAVGEGVIVNVASVDGLKGRAGGAAYCASKAGVIRFTESLADEVSHFGVRANVVCPAGVNTPMWRLHHPDDDPATVLQPRDVADTIVFLASPNSRAINGAVVELLGPRLNWGTFL